MRFTRREITLILAIVIIVAGIAFGQWYEQKNSSTTSSNMPKSETLSYMSHDLNVSVEIALNGEILSLNVSMMNNDTARTHIGVVNLKSPSGKTLLNVEEALKPQQRFFKTYTLNVTGLRKAEVSIFIDPQAKVSTGISKTIQLSSKK